MRWARDRGEEFGRVEGVDVVESKGGGDAELVDQVREYGGVVLWGAEGSVEMGREWG